MTRPAGRPPHRLARRAAAALSALAVVTAGCAATGDDGAAGDAVTVSTCGRDIVFEKAPERVVITKSEPISLLQAVGAGDTVVARSGFIPTGYPQQYRAALEAVPALSEEVDDTGHTLISTEEVLAQQPDLVIASPSTVDIDTLAGAGIPTYTPQEYCDHGETATEPQASFDRIAAEIDTYGRIFRAPAAAQTAVEQARQEEESIPQAPEPLRAAALYFTPGAETLYSYGTSSQLDAIIRATGMTQVFDDVSRRVGEVSAEQLVARTPDVLILAFDSPTPVDIAAEFRDTAFFGTLERSRPAGAPELQLVPVDFQLTDPPSPATLVGAHVVGEAVAGARR